ncbi:MAG: Unknown protein [uncultured Thiotrichaceae bacterium]|uniref:Prolyl 4-hydroxylase alpha subunit Fe(2+) 2OG dioxygenase domain-containing protein n=1 Tax=uncultured Thiotrichaceae bacterium TaxID=298394 RepID=A0A6S6U4F1_9GAMM|nr:MAG: Unknown protein [uncultured Thiotrichaceae bacterium]
MQNFTQISLKQSDSNNQMIIEQYQQLLSADKAQKTHFFEGRYENIYIDKVLLTSTQNLFSEITTIAQQVIGTKQKLRMGFWFNEMQPGFRTVAHTHDENDELLSGVYYLNVPKRSGDLLLGKGDDQIKIAPKAGDCIFFTPDVIHEVLPNESAEMRLSIGMNFGYAERME